MNPEKSPIPPEGTWAGRAWIPKHLARNSIAGPRVIGIHQNRVLDLSGSVRTFSELINSKDPLDIIRNANAPLLPSIEELANTSLYPKRDKQLANDSHIHLLAPNDLLATKACGVTFIKSLLERVVEEKAKGNPALAKQVRQLILDTIGEDLSNVKPGSPETTKLKEKLIEKGAWSQYLEVGIGPDAEVFTKAQPMSSVGYGAQIGIHPHSKWNNPEPEVVLAVSKSGNIIGATLGNDVNLRDFEGRSALLLGEAKDQNASCSIGPLVRFFDETFSLEDVKNADIELSITGEDGFHTSGCNKMSEISRSPEELVSQALGDTHQYPDGMMLFLGTMFAPTDNRGEEGAGFTHHIGDRVDISSPKLGRLTNWVARCNEIPPWDYGISELFNYLLSSEASKA